MTSRSGSGIREEQRGRVPKGAAGSTMPALSVAAGLLTATLALHMALIAFGNITDFGTNQAFVRHVLAMDSTFKDPDLMWRAITSHTLQDLAYVAIIAWETLTALALIAACVFWVRDGRRRTGNARARRLSTYGLLMVLLLFGAGFIAIGGEWFAMWQSKDWNGLEAATRNFLLAATTLIVVHLPGAATRAEGEAGAETEPARIPEPQASASQTSAPQTSEPPSPEPQ